MNKVPFKLFDCVEYLGPYLPENGLKNGQVGTILEIYDKENCEVEFTFSDGTTRELCSFHVSQLRRVD